MNLRCLTYPSCSFFSLSPTSWTWLWPCETVMGVNVISSSGDLTISLPTHIVSAGISVHQPHSSENRNFSSAIWAYRQFWSLASASCSQKPAYTLTLQDHGYGASDRVRPSWYSLRLYTGGMARHALHPVTKMTFDICYNATKTVQLMQFTRTKNWR